MASYTSGGGTFYVRIQADDITGGGYTNHFRAYRRSKTMLRIVPSASGMMLYTVGLGLRTQTYFSDSSGHLIIPIKGWLESLSDGVPTLMGISKASVNAPGTVLDTITMYVTVVGGVAYVDNPAPLEKGLPSAWSSWAHRPDAVVIPNVIYTHPNGYMLFIETNLPLASQNGVGAYAVVGGSQSVVNGTGHRGNQLPVPPPATAVGLADKSVNFEVKTEYAGDCEQLVFVRWTSLTGAIRQHYFPVVGYIRSSDKGVTLVGDSDGYLSKRDATLALRCRITGLTAYSLWYYADLVQASDVHASTDFLSAPPMTYDDTAVNVEDTSVDIADGSGFHTFEFTLKYKHYDTF